VAGDRCAARADRAAAALGELLAGGPDRPVRPVLGALPGPRARVRRRGRPPGRRVRALPGVLEPRVHAVRPGAGGRAHAAAGAEHRHRDGPQPDGVDPAGHAVDLRDRPVPAADRARRGAQRQALRRDVRDRPRAADPRRPHARDELPGRGRRRAVERGPRLRAAAPDAPRGRPGPADRDRGGVPAAVRGRRPRADGARVPGDPRAPRHDPDVARARGGGVQPHARAGHPAPR
jgi:hypothetical protein